MTTRRLSCDVAVVGAGPAGIAAATRAAGHGRRVVVLDEGLAAGGQIWRHGSHARAPDAARPWFARFVSSGANAVFGANVVDIEGRDGAFTITAEHGTSPLVVTAGRIVLATGARELLLPFPGWTLPGVMGIGGAQALLKNGASFAGKRVVIAGSGPLLLPVAAALVRAGARLAMVAEQAPLRAVAAFAAGLVKRPGMLMQAARYRALFRGAPYRAGMWVTHAEGDDTVRRVTLTDGRRSRSYGCDVLCAAFGLTPNTELARLLGCALEAGSVSVDDAQTTTVAGVFCAGEPTGIGGVDLASIEGEIAGHAAAGAPDDAQPLLASRDRLRTLAAAMTRAFALRDELRSLATPETIVCRCEDVTLGALAPDWTPRQARLYTRCGMGPCQGRICGAALQFLRGWPSDTVRPPVEPVLLSTLLADVAPVAASSDTGA